MTFENMAADVAALIRWLGYAKSDVMGYSMGGVTALRLAIDSPEVVKKLVVVSTPHCFAAFQDYNQQGTRFVAADPVAASEGLKQTPMYEMYRQLQPNPDNWVKTVTQTGALVGNEFDWTDRIPAIPVPTMIIVGDWDSIRIGHATRMFELLGGSQQDAQWDGSGANAHRFAVLANLTHYTIFSSPRLAEAAIPFLEGTPIGA